MLFIYISLSSCTNDAVSVNTKSLTEKIEINTDVKNYTDTIVKQEITQSEEIQKNPINEIAKLIAGMPSDSFPEIRESQYYKVHQAEIEKSWKNAQNQLLNKIEKWKAEENIISLKDTLPLFYPFSGPDFLFANVFYPHAPLYVLIGLENTGKIPDLKTMTDDSRKEYFENLRYSLRYINKMGFFVTEQMMDDLSKSNLDGTVHVLLFYLARTNHTITQFNTVFINSFGKPDTTNQKKAGTITGICIGFKTTDNISKKLYYFPVDVSDANLKDKPEVLYFLNNLGEKNIYIKSGSYLFFDNSFSLLRKLVLSQTNKLIQDDSGIPYKMLVNAGYTIKLYGTYTRTLKIFGNYFQPDLADDVKMQKESRKLNFIFGYNAAFGETLLMVARTKSDEKEVVENNNKVIYKVQIRTSWQKLDTANELFNGLQNIDYYFDKGYYKYTIGNENSEEACSGLLKTANDKGFKDAFVVAFYNGNRITLDEAKKITNQ